MLATPHWLTITLLASVAIGGGVPAQRSSQDEAGDRMVLRPDPDSDETAATVVAFADGTGGTHIWMEGRASSGASGRYYVSVDLAARTYRLFSLGGADTEASDAQRIQDYLAGRGRYVSYDSLLTTLQEARTLHDDFSTLKGIGGMGGQATVAPTANARHSHPGAVSKASDYVLLAVDDSASRVFGWCDGYAWSSSVTVDPVNIALNQTAQQAAWQGFYYYMEPYGWSGYCDAYSSITTWFVDSCYGYTPYSTSNIDYSRDGQYHNYDFGLPDERTDVYSRAGVQAYDSSFVNWWTYWYASGEFSWLLDEVVGHDYQQGSCY